MARPPGASLRRGRKASGVTGRVHSPGAPPPGRRLGGRHREWQRRRARRHRRGAETRELVGASSGAGRAGRGEGGAGAGAGAASAGRGVASSWSGVGGRGSCGEAGGRADWRQRARTGNGGWVRAARAGRRRCSPDLEKEGRKPAGGGGRRRQRQRVRLCVIGRGRRCVRARLSPLSSCHQQPLLLLQSRAGQSG